MVDNQEDFASPLERKLAAEADALKHAQLTAYARQIANEQNDALTEVIAMGRKLGEAVGILEDALEEADALGESLKLACESLDAEVAALLVALEVTDEHMDKMGNLIGQALERCRRPHHEAPSGEGGVG